MSDTATATQNQPGTIEVNALDLTHGQVLVGDAGGHSLIMADGRPNTLVQGFVAVETEHGFLLLDDDREITFTVLA